MSLNSENLRLSVSKTKTFLNCKAQYKFAYVLKLPQKDQDFHIFGKFCHKVLEDFHNHYINNPISTSPFHVEMKIAWNLAIQEYNGQMTSQMKKDCWDIIDEYLQIISNDKKNNLSANVLSCEKNFYFNISENLILNGMIDRIQLDSDGVIHVCDYKTVKNKTYIKDDFFQLLTYCYVICLDNPEITQVRASYILLRHNFEYITKDFFLPEILSIKEKYQDYANSINLETEFSPNPSFLCSYCSFLDKCPAGKSRVINKEVFGEVAW